MNLKKLTGKQNAKVVSEALPDSMSGGSSEFVVTFTEDGGNVTADKTYSEVLAAYNNGDKIVGKVANVNGELWFKLDNHNRNNNTFNFSSTVHSTSGHGIIWFITFGNNSIMLDSCNLEW